jgi:CRISPR-associated endonuclease/helicase Cas3
MGIGKTEAAFYLIRHWEAGIGLRGSYFALPTQATSNQMFTRAREFLEKTYLAQVNLQLLHGHAALSHELQLLQQGYRHLLTPRYSGDNHEDSQRVISAEWFTYRKRGLLAPFGVGTVDQALLGMLQTRHFFVRLFGLTGKTVIIDEVHAYEAYMTTLLERLLEWLAALGSPVVLLSATLPAERRKGLARAYAKGLGLNPVPTLSQPDYPRITWVTPSNQGVQSITQPPESSRELILRWIPDDLTDLPSRLQGALTNGGCAAIICNTVRRAQEVYHALKPLFPGVADDGGPKLELFHSQFLYQDREDREKRALSRFGKPDGKVILSDGQEVIVQRPGKAILVATQVIEQSLDLDFDLMVTDIAPIDLLLQRAGRLHRHERGEKRPQGLGAAQLWVRQPVLADGVPQFDGGSASVYEPHLLLRTWLALQERTDQGIVTLKLPDDIDALVQQVYRDGSAAPDLAPALRDALEDTKIKMNDELQKEATEAKDRWIKGPDYEGALWRLAQDPKEEDTLELHQVHRALTRWGPPNVQVVLLYGNNEQPAWDRERLNLISNIKETPKLEQARQLLSCSATLSDPRVVFELLGQHPPPAWRRSSLLRNHRLLFVGQAIGKYHITIDDETGISIS